MTDHHGSTTDDVHALSGAYAIDALDDEEREQFELHLHECPACRAEVRGLLEATAALAEETMAEPPASLRASVLDSIDSVRPLPPVTTADSLPAPRRLGQGRWAFRMPGPQLVAAAAVLVLAVGALAVWQPWTDSGGGPTQLTAQDVLEAPDVIRDTQRLPGGATATVALAPSLGKAVVVTDDLRSAPEGRVYELWLQTPGGDLHPAGLLPDDADTTVLLEGDATRATAVGITVEPDGGSSQPTTEPIAWFDVNTARS